MEFMHNNTNSSKLQNNKTNVNEMKKYYSVPQYIFFIEIIRVFHASASNGTKIQTIT